MKKIKYWPGILSFVLILGMMAAGCDNGTTPDNVVNDEEFIGTWQELPQDTIWIFSKGAFINKFPNGNFRGKGTWSAKHPDKISIVWTHYSGDGVAIIGDLPERQFYGEEFIFEFFSNSFFRINRTEDNSIIFYFTRVQ